MLWFFSLAEKKQFKDFFLMPPFRFHDIDVALTPTVLVFFLSSLHFTQYFLMPVQSPCVIWECVKCENSSSGRF